jgi:hypothetical protein
MDRYLTAKYHAAMAKAMAPAILAGLGLRWITPKLLTDASQPPPPP